MDANIMKKMVVLKNLQSNMIEEAYIVFKNNAKIYKYDKINKQNIDIDNMDNKDKEKGRNFIIKEAEMVVNDYICKMESKEFRFNNKSLKKRNDVLKVTTISFALLSILNFVMFILK